MEQGQNKVQTNVGHVGHSSLGKTFDLIEETASNLLRYIIVNEKFENRIWKAQLCEEGHGALLKI